MTLGLRRIGTKKRHQVAAQSWQQLIPSATNVEVSGTTPISAQAEEEEERTRGKEKTKAKEHRTRRVRDQARGQARAAQAREEKAQRTGAGIAEVLTSVMTAQAPQESQGRKEDSNLLAQWSLERGSRGLGR